MKSTLIFANFARRGLRLACVSRGRGAVLASASSAPSASAAGTYARQEPENTVLHRIVREHLAIVREERGKSLPCYVEEELRRYLRCGILAHGFLRVVCLKCRQEIVV